MKVIKRMLMGTSILLLLNGCIFDANPDEASTDESETTEEVDNESNVVSRNQLGKNYYPEFRY